MQARAALLEAGHEEAPEADADLHVVNTCCITREAEAKSRQSVRRSAGGRRGAPCGRDRLRGEPERGAVRRDRARGDRSGRHRGRRRGRGGRHRRTGVHRPRTARRAAADRPHPRVREGAGRLRLPLLVLHHPEGPRRRALPPCQRRAARGAPARGAGTAGDGDDRHLGGRLPRPGARPRARRPDARGRGDRGRRARAPVVGRGDPRARLAARRACARSRASARTCTFRSSPATTRCWPRWGATTTPPDTSRRSPGCASGCRM